MHEYVAERVNTDSLFVDAIGREFAYQCNRGKSSDDEGSRGKTKRLRTHAHHKRERAVPYRFVCGWGGGGPTTK